LPKTKLLGGGHDQTKIKKDKTRIWSDEELKKDDEVHKDLFREIPPDVVDDIVKKNRRERSNLKYDADPDPK